MFIALTPLLLFSPATATAAEIFVNPFIGSDQNPGTQDAPLASGQKAVSRAKAGDVIHLLPEKAVYGQSITVAGRDDLTIEGHGVILDGADPLPAEGWEDQENGVHRRRMKRTLLDRHLLIVDGKCERMRRTQSSNSPAFPPHDQLRPGEFCFEPIDDKEGWLYVRGSVEKLEWSTRLNGIATGGKVNRLTVRNLTARHFLNDGFNIHGETYGAKFEHIEGSDCFDEGFSAHEACTCEIEDGLFFGNENAIADVNESETHYRRCEFRDSVNVDVLLAGARHSFTDCRILNTTAAIALSASPRPEEKDQRFEVTLTRVEILGQGPRPALVRISGGTAQLTDCRLENVTWKPEGAKVRLEGTRVSSERAKEDAGPSGDILAGRSEHGGLELSGTEISWRRA
jgi:hypothetical protein